jgi:hypothetical protein
MKHNSGKTKHFVQNTNVLNSCYFVYGQTFVFLMTLNGTSIDVLNIYFLML